jgi:PDZ domain
MKKVMYGFCLLASAIFAVAAAHAQSGGGGGGGASGGAGAGGGAGASSGAGTSGAGGTSGAAATSSGTGTSGTASSPSAQQMQGAAQQQQGLQSTQPGTFNSSGNQFNQGAAQPIQPGAARGQAGQLLQDPQSGVGTESGAFPQDNRFGSQRGLGTQGNLNNLQRGNQDVQPGFQDSRLQSRVQDGNFQDGMQDRMPPPDDIQARQSADAGMENSGTMRDGQHGELGVWLTAAAGPGVEIRRITEGSAADETGLEPGDVLLQVNGRGVSSPMEVQQMIRAIPPGQTAMLEIWRDGAQHEVSATLQPAQDSYNVGYRGNESRSNRDDTAARTERLEEQVSMLMREVQQMRAQMQQMSSAGGAGQPASAGRPSQPSTPTGPENFEDEATDSTRPAMPKNDLGRPSTTPQPEQSATEPQETAGAESEPQPQDDLFGNEPAAGTATEETPPAETETETEAETNTDSLFQ